MTSAREEIIGRVRAALADVPADDVTPVDWDYGQPVSTGELGRVDRFAERVSDYKAIVEQVAADEVTQHVTAALASVDGPVIADAVVRDLLADAPVTWCSDDDLSPTELDAAGAVVTTTPRDAARPRRPARRRWSHRSPAPTRRRRSGRRTARARGVRRPAPPRPRRWPRAAAAGARRR